MAGNFKYTKPPKTFAGTSKLTSVQFQKKYMRTHDQVLQGYNVYKKHISSNPTHRLDSPSVF